MKRKEKNRINSKNLMKMQRQQQQKKHKIVMMC